MFTSSNYPRRYESPGNQTTVTDAAGRLSNNLNILLATANKHMETATEIN